MSILLLALIGVPIGLALDALAARLAVPFDDEDEEDGAPTPVRRLQAEAGALVLDEAPGHSWARRALIVAATAGLFAVAGARYDEPGHLALITSYVCVLLVCTTTDLINYRVPNVVTYPAIAGALVVGAVVPGAHLLDVALGGLMAAGVLFVPALFTGGVGIGMGDVKLALFVGFALGLNHVIPAVLVMALSGGGVAILLLITGLRKRGEPIPYAPFIALGALAALLWQGAAFVKLT